MPFLIGETLEARATKIRQFLRADEPVIAILLAAADFERTVRRAIIGLSKEPTRELTERIEARYNTFGRYRDAWRDLVSEGTDTQLDVHVLTNYQEVCEAFKLRNAFIHGGKAGASRKFAEKNLSVLLAATRTVTEFTQKHDVILTDKIKTRRAPKELRQDN